MPDGEITSANDFYLKVFGLKSTQGIYWHSLIHADDLHVFFERVASLSPDNPSVWCEGRALTARGYEYQRWLARGVFEGGLLVEIHGIGTPTNPAKTKFMKYRRRYPPPPEVLSLSDYIRGKPAALSTGEEILWGNQGLCELFEISRAQMLGKNPRNYYVNPTYRDWMQRRFAAGRDVVTISPYYRTFKGGMIKPRQTTTLVSRSPLKMLSTFDY